MDATTWGSIGTAAGAVVALGAMITAILQARIAKASAAATVEQLGLLRHQVDAESADRDSRDAPSFMLVLGPAELGECVVGGGGSVTFVPLTKNIGIPPARWAKRRPVDFRMTAGPERVSAEVELINPYGDDVRLLQGGGPHEIVRGAARCFVVTSASRLDGRPLEVVIHSTESQGARRRWTCRQEIRL